MWSAITPAVGRAANRCRWVVGAAVSGLLLAGCYAQTEPATNVGSTSATLNAHGYTTGHSAQAFFQYSTAKNALGTGFGLQTPTLNFGPNLSGPFAADVSGLSSGSNYFFRVCGNDAGRQPACNSDLEFTTTVPGAAAAFGPPLDTAGAGVLATGDFNGDGIPDLVVADSPLASSTKVDILLGNEDATFRQAGTVDIGEQPIGAPLAVGDVNRDGKQDLIVGVPPSSGGSTSSIEVFPGRGDGTFGAPLITTGPPPFVQQIAVGDFNGDGRPDIALITTEEPSLTGIAEVMLGNGNGTFQPPDQTFGGARWFALVTGDFNRDGRLDLALAEEMKNSSSGVAVLLGNGNGTFGPEHVYDAGTGTTGLVAGAFHGGNTLDLVARTVPSGLTVLNGKGDGTFQVGASYNTPDAPVQATDINGDGKLDLVAFPTNSSGGADVWLGNGNGTLQSPIVGVSCRPFLVADFNGDGKPDIACTGSAVTLNATAPPPG